PAMTRIYDRAALIALPRHLRDKYLHFTLQWRGTNKNSNFKYLLITIGYGGKEVDPLGPPFSVEESEITSILKGTDFIFSPIHRHSFKTVSEKFIKAEIPELVETIYLGQFDKR